MYLSFVGEREAGGAKGGYVGVYLGKGELLASGGGGMGKGEDRRTERIWIGSCRT